MKVKAHLVIPKEILEEVDQIAGKRGRSLFIAEAALEKLERERFLKILEETRGAWVDKRHPDLRFRSRNGYEEKRGGKNESVSEGPQGFRSQPGSGFPSR
jgi:hypothetical protein